MEQVLDIYKRPYDEKKPWICRRESCKQLVKETRDPIPSEPGKLERYDYQYERNGVANLFMFFEPLTGWRHVEVTNQRTAIDYAHQMKYLVDERYPQAEKIGVIQDQLNTHVKASLYKAFEPENYYVSLKLGVLSVTNNGVKQTKLSTSHCCGALKVLQSVLNIFNLW